jgi:hypothetical protein
MTEIALAVINELIQFERLVGAARRGCTITLGLVDKVLPQFD